MEDENVVVMAKTAKKRKRSSKSKSPRQKRMQYSKESLESALSEVKSKNGSLRSVATKFKIPESTIRAKLGHKYAEKKPGPQTVLTSDEEAELVKWIVQCSKAGFPVDKNMLLDNVQMLCDKLKKKTPFVNNKPGQSWYNSFLRRHPDLSLRMSENVTLSRARVTKESLQNWFKQVGDYLESLGISEMQPNRIFNGDESGIKFYVNLVSEKQFYYHMCKLL